VAVPAGLDLDAPINDAPEDVSENSDDDIEDEYSYGAAAANADKQKQAFRWEHVD